ncbi:MAG TPA: amidohydrolase [Vicinamibacterales bacterium]|nr:amidohydrolase [Vicinamibacterales bacterium]
MMVRVFVAAIAMALAACQARGPVEPVTLIVHNAKVYTVNAAQPQAEAVAVRGDRIVLVGSTDAALALRGPETRVIDAKGATLIPGIQDSHGHFTNLGASLQILPLRGTTSYERIVEMVRARAATARPGEWIQGRSWDQNLWPVKDWPHHAQLTAAAPNNPVYLTRVDGHAALVNKAALDAAGVTRSTQDPPGGRIIRDANGDPAGVLIDSAQDLVGSKIPPVSTAQLEEQILLADTETRKLGLTMVHDAGTTPENVTAYQRLIDAGRLKTRLYVMLRGPLSMLELEFKKGPLINYGGHRLSVRAIKIGADGALGSRGAALLEPYSDEPSTSGLMTTPPEEIYAQTLAASRAGFQTCIHAIGDRGNRVALDVFERVQAEISGARNLRMRIEHAQILDAAEIPRFAQLNVIASMQATHATSDMPWVPARIGDARADEGAYVWQRLIQSGVVLANGSDFPVEEPNPMLGFYAAITRQDPTGQPPGGWMPDERLSRDEMLKSFTWNAAYAAHAEQDLGSLEVGKLADMVLLDKDVMTVEPQEILSTRPLVTIVGGEVVYHRQQ